MLLSRTSRHPPSPKLSQGAWILSHHSPLGPCVNVSGQELWHPQMSPQLESNSAKNRSPRKLSHHLLHLGKVFPQKKQANAWPPLVAPKRSFNPALVAHGPQVGPQCRSSLPAPPAPLPGTSHLQPFGAKGPNYSQK